MMRIKDEERLKQYMINVISIIKSREGECIVNFWMKFGPDFS